MVEAPVKQLLIQQLVFKAGVVSMAVKKLKQEGKQKDPLLLDPHSKYYKNIDLYAINTYAIYPCFKCRDPFIGGKVSCEREAEMNNQNNGEAFKPEDYVCMKCSDIKKCVYHGTEGMIFKCRFCCNLSVWFCFGNTHFCDQCHSKQVGNRQYAVTKELWTHCQGGDRCPVGQKHPEPGTEFSVGCELCLGK